MKVTLFMSVALTGLLLGSLSSCTKDENSSGNQLYVELTDAPIDDANIQGVFVTVADLKVDGNSFDNFGGKQSINLLAYQNGQVKSLGNTALETGTYTYIDLVLDYDQDANGNSPGCYVLTKDGVKHALKASANASSTITATGVPVMIDEHSNATAVLDFDLRKAIQYGATSSGQAYQFVTDAELNTAVRLTTKAQTGMISGQCVDPLGLAGSKIVVYAYKKGSFTNSELQAQGSSGILFKNAVTSAVCDANGNFNLAFLESGDYELHFIGYEDKDGDGKLDIKGTILLQVLGNLELDAVRVSTQATTQVNVSVTGIIPL